MFKCTQGLLLILALTAISSPALAAKCAERAQIVERLQSKYSEQLTVGGLQRAKHAISLMEIWASKETGTYTVLLTNPNGTSCIVAAGTDFFEAVPKIARNDTAS
jgi:hypothetical protein